MNTHRKIKTTNERRANQRVKGEDEPKGRAARRHLPNSFDDVLNDTECRLYKLLRRWVRDQKQKGVKFNDAYGKLQNKPDLKYLSRTDFNFFWKLYGAD